MFGYRKILYFQFKTGLRPCGFPRKNEVFFVIRSPLSMRRKRHSYFAFAFASKDPLGVKGKICKGSFGKSALFKAEGAEFFDVSHGVAPQDFHLQSFFRKPYVFLKRQHDPPFASPNDRFPAMGGPKGNSQRVGKNHGV